MRSAQSKPISTVSGSVFRVPVSLFGDLCLGHCEGQLSRFPLGGARPALGAQAAGGGAVLLGTGWGFNFRGICNGWGAALGTWWRWAILGGKGGGEGAPWTFQAIGDSALSVGTGRTRDGQGRPTQHRGFSRPPGPQRSSAATPSHPGPGNETSRNCWPVRGRWRLARAELLGYEALPQLSPWYY